MVRSGIHGLNEELDRHKGREGKKLAGRNVKCGSCIVEVSSKMRM